MKVRTMRGKLLDMGSLVNKNAKKVALGNASMNARGDIVGRRGVIVKSREAVVQEYHASNPKAVKQVALRDISKEVFVSPAEAVEAIKSDVKETAAHPAPQRKPRKIEDRDD